jgi:hypothetical protein
MDYVQSCVDWFYFDFPSLSSAFEKEEQYENDNMRQFAERLGIKW